VNTTTPTTASSTLSSYSSSLLEESTSPFTNCIVNNNQITTESCSSNKNNNSKMQLAKRKRQSYFHDNRQESVFTPFARDILAADPNARFFDEDGEELKDVTEARNITTVQSSVLLLGPKYTSTNSSNGRIQLINLKKKIKRDLNNKLLPYTPKQGCRISLPVEDVVLNFIDNYGPNILEICKMGNPTISIFNTESNKEILHYTITRMNAKGTNMTLLNDYETEEIRTKKIKDNSDFRLLFHDNVVLRGALPNVAAQGLKELTVDTNLVQRMVSHYELGGRTKTNAESLVSCLLVLLTSITDFEQQDDDDDQQPVLDVRNFVHSNGTQLTDDSLSTLNEVAQNSNAAIGVGVTNTNQSIYKYLSIDGTMPIRGIYPNGACVAVRCSMAKYIKGEKLFESSDDVVIPPGSGTCAETADGDETIPEAISNAAAATVSSSSSSRTPNQVNLSLMEQVDPIPDRICDSINNNEAQGGFILNSDGTCVVPAEFYHTLTNETNVQIFRDGRATLYVLKDQLPRFTRFFTRTSSTITDPTTEILLVHGTTRKAAISICLIGVLLTCLWTMHWLLGCYFATGISVFVSTVATSSSSTPSNSSNRSTPSSSNNSSNSTSNSEPLTTMAQDDEPDDGDRPLIVVDDGGPPITACYASTLQQDTFTPQEILLKFKSGLISVSTVLALTTAIKVVGSTWCSRTTRAVVGSHDPQHEDVEECGASASRYEYLKKLRTLLSEWYNGVQYNLGGSHLVTLFYVINIGTILENTLLWHPHLARYTEHGKETMKKDIGERMHNNNVSFTMQSFSANYTRGFVLTPFILYKKIKHHASKLRNALGNIWNVINLPIAILDIKILEDDKNKYVQAKNAIGIVFQAVIQALVQSSSSLLDVYPAISSDGIGMKWVPVSTHAYNKFTRHPTWPKLQTMLNELHLQVVSTSNPYYRMTACNHYLEKLVVGSSNSNNNNKKKIKLFVVDGG
jgi:hypothetical protein